MSVTRPDGDPSLILHASCVAWDGAAVLVTGASGRGKSGLALQLMALGAGLVADDRTCLWLTGDAADAGLVADTPEVLRDRIEARCVGILTARAVGPSRVALVVDLDHSETERLPPFRTTEVLGCRLPLLHMVDSPSFPAAVLQYLKAGRSA